MISFQLPGQPGRLPPGFTEKLRKEVPREVVTQDASRPRFCGVFSSFAGLTIRFVACELPEDRKVTFWQALRSHKRCLLQHKGPSAVVAPCLTGLWCLPSGTLSRPIGRDLGHHPRGFSRITLQGLICAGCCILALASLRHIPGCSDPMNTCGQFSAGETGIDFSS